VSAFLSLLAVVLAGTQLALLAALTVFGVHRAWLAWLAWRCGRGALDALRPPPAAVDPSAGSSARPLPGVTVQLPLYNERAVTERLLRAVAALDYPRDRLQVQVLDDSDDDTSRTVERVLEQLPPDLEIAHLRRSDRAGYKAGALRWGLHLDGPDRARHELIAIFDADFVPPPDFLLRAVAPFENPRVGMVQARWEHLDAEFSLLTRLQALLLDGHFAVEHVARAGGGHFFNFNGTAGVFRRAAIDDAGGWLDDTLTEDMDLSYRAQLRGWEFVYVPGLTCPAELPVEPAAFMTQQYRWAKGGIQTARKHLQTVWRSPLRLSTRIEAAFHLLGNLAFPLLLLLILVALPLQVLRAGGHAPAGAFWVTLENGPLLLGTLGVLVYYGFGQLRLRRFDATTWVLLPAVLAIGAGLSINNTRAVWRGLGGPVGAFVRTPKRAAVHKSVGDRGSGAGPRRGWLPFAETALGCYALATAILAARGAWWGTAAFHGLFAVGLAGFGVGSLLPLARAQRRP